MNIEPGKYLVVRREGDPVSGSRSQGTVRLPSGGSVTITNPKPAAPPPPSGLPVIPAAYGTLFRKVFSDGSLAPFKVQTFFDDHIGQPGQWSTVFGRFSNGVQQVSVHDGYADLRAVKRPDGLWDCVLLCSSVAWDRGPTFGYGITRFWLRFNVGPGVWQAAWLYDTTTWTATELDWPEMLEAQQMSAHVLGQSAGGKYGPPPADIATTWHLFSIERRASFVSFGMDGVEFHRQTGPMPASPLAIMLCTSIGHGWVGAGGGITAATPSPTFLHVAAVCVDP